MWTLTLIDRTGPEWNLDVTGTTGNANVSPINVHGGTGDPILFIEKSISTTPYKETDVIKELVIWN